MKTAYPFFRWALPLGMACIFVVNLLRVVAQPALLHHILVGDFPLFDWACWGAALSC